MLYNRSASPNVHVDLDSPLYNNIIEIVWFTFTLKITKLNQWQLQPKTQYTQMIYFKRCIYGVH